MKSLTHCSYCDCLFEDKENDGFCRDCMPKFFIDNALASIDDAIKDLENVRKIESSHLLKRNKQLRNLSLRLDQLQQVE